MGSSQKRDTSRDKGPKGGPTAQKILNAGIFIKKGGLTRPPAVDIQAEAQAEAGRALEGAREPGAGGALQEVVILAQHKQEEGTRRANRQKKGKNLSVALKYKKSGNLFEGQAGVEKTKPHKFESQFISSRTGLQLSKEDFLRLQTNSGKSRE